MERNGLAEKGRVLIERKGVQILPMRLIILPLIFSFGLFCVTEKLKFLFLKNILSSIK
jgi:hypothetical protein